MKIHIFSYTSIINSPLLRITIEDCPVLWPPSVTVQVYCIDESVAVTTIVLFESSEGDHLYCGLLTWTTLQVSESEVFSHNKLSVSVTLDVIFTSRSLDDAIQNKQEHAHNVSDLAYKIQAYGNKLHYILQ